MILAESVTKLLNFISPCRAASLYAIRQNMVLDSVQNAGLKTSVEERIGLPPKPKKPLTPYFRYMKEIRPLIKADNPKASSQDIIKMIAGKWETVNEDTKRKLQEEFKKEQETYIVSRAKYDSKITEDQREDIKTLKQEIAEAKERREFKKKVRELGRPKRPASAFLRFLSNERRETPQNNLSYREWHMKATEKWTRLSDKDKQNFMEDTKKEMEKYKQELGKWEEKMVRLGNIDVVRNEALIEPPPAKPRKKSNTVNHTEANPLPKYEELLPRGYVAKMNKEISLKEGTGEEIENANKNENELKTNDKRDGNDKSNGMFTKMKSIFNKFV